MTADSTEKVITDDDGNNNGEEDVGASSDATVVPLAKEEEGQQGTEDRQEHDRSDVLSSNDDDDDDERGNNDEGEVGCDDASTAEEAIDVVKQIVVGDDDKDRNENQGKTDDECCPICLHHPNERRFSNRDDHVQNENSSSDDDALVCGPCGHALCVECMEHLLNADALVEQQWPPQSANDIHLSAPTLGRCPICRTVLSLFDIHIQRKMNTASRGERAENEYSQIDQTVKYLYPKNSNCWDHESKNGKANPLIGSVYIPYRGKPGQVSFHWDWKKLKRHSEESETIQRPFLNFTDSIRARPDHWKLEDGRLAPKIAFFERGCHFHERSRTFHGTILWPIRLNGSYEWDVILGFSKDYRFLSSGRVHMKRERNLNDPRYNESDRQILQKRLHGMKTEHIELCKYPMDGKWTVSWNDNLGHPHQKELHVIGSEYRQSGWAFHISFDDPRHPTIRWPRSRHRQWVEDGVNLIQYPMGPPPGQKIRWRTSDPRFPVLWWTRQTVGPVPLPKVILFGMGQEKHLYQRLHAKTDRSIPRYCGRSVFGNVFTKRLYIGSASYHFLSPTNSFISYRHPACRDLPTLDDGSPLPTRVDFHSIDWDPQQRKLSATIEWEKDFGTTWNDNVRWTLTMYFDSEYMVILKGGIHCEWCKERRARSRPPQPPPRHRPPPVPVYVPPPSDNEEEQTEESPSSQRNEEWVMSGYGYDQVYVNAAAIERYRQKKPKTLISTEDQGSEDDDDYDGERGEEKKAMGEEMSGENDQEGEQTTGSIRDEEDDGDDDDDDANDHDVDGDVDFHALAEQHANRLKDEGATERTISFLTYLFNIVSADGQANPIDFLVD